MRDKLRDVFDDIWDFISDVSRFILCGTFATLFVIGISFGCMAAGYYLCIGLYRLCYLLHDEVNLRMFLWDLFFVLTIGIALYLIVYILKRMKKKTKTLYFAISQKQNNDLYRDYIAYLENQRLLHHIIKEIAQKYEIYQVKYDSDKDLLYSEKCICSFISSMEQSCKVERVYYRKNSDIGKEFSKQNFKKVQYPKASDFLSTPIGSIRNIKLILFKNVLYIRVVKKKWAKIKYPDEWRRIPQVLYRYRCVAAKALAKRTV